MSSIMLKFNLGPVCCFIVLWWVLFCFGFAIFLGFCVYVRVHVCVLLNCFVLFYFLLLVMLFVCLLFFPSWYTYKNQTLEFSLRYKHTWDLFKVFIKYVGAFLFFSQPLRTVASWHLLISSKQSFLKQLMKSFLVKILIYLLGVSSPAIKPTRPHTESMKGWMQVCSVEL